MKLDGILMQEGSEYEPRERERERWASFGGDRNLKGEHVSACLIEGGTPCVRLELGRTLLKRGAVLKTADIKGS